jgi:hypothetical protein
MMSIFEGDSGVERWVHRAGVGNDLHTVEAARVRSNLVWGQQKCARDGSQQRCGLRETPGAGMAARTSEDPCA